MSDHDEKATASEMEKSLPGQNTPPSSNGADAEWDEAEEKRIRNRLDWHLVPLVTVLYLLCFLDRANIGNARIQGMEPELALDIGVRFNWALTIFYIPYLIFEVPSNIILKHTGAKIWIPFLVFAFGFCSLCTAFVQTHAQLFVCRAFLGLFEGGTMPGIAFFLSNFYRRGELMFRIGFFISASSMSGAFGGLLATGLAKIPLWGVDATPIHTWRNIFFFEGIATMAIAGISYFYLSNTPAECNFLSPREKFIAITRVEREHQENLKEKTTLHHVRRGLFNINTIICSIGFFFNNVSVQSFSLFMPTILREIGPEWSTTKVQLMTVPPYVLAAAWSILISWISDKYRKRGLFALGHACVAILGYAVLIGSEKANVKYMATFFGAVGCYPIGPIFLAWGINNSAGPTIRAVSSASIVSIGTLGSILATWTYVKDDAPKYKKGHSINVGAQSAVALMAVLGVIYVKWENGKRERGERDKRVEGMSELEALKLGYRNPRFRYIE